MSSVTSQTGQKTFLVMRWGDLFAMTEAQRERQKRTEG